MPQKAHVTITTEHGDVYATAVDLGRYAVKHGADDIGTVRRNKKVGTWTAFRVDSTEVGDRPTRAAACRALVEDA